MSKKRINRKSTGRKYAAQKKYNARPEQKKYRAQLNRYNRQKGTYGNGDGLDASHVGGGTSGRIKGFEKASTNRTRKTKSSRKPKK